MDTQNTSRLSFHGFTAIRRQDTSTHEVEIGKIKVGDEVLIVHMVRKAGLHFKGNFFVASIFDGIEEKCLWEFKKQGFEGFGLLVAVSDDVVVALVAKGRDGKVEDVVSLSSLAKDEPLELCRKVVLKRLAAEALRREYSVSETERKALRHTRKEKEDTKKTTCSEREQLRREKISLIMDRPRITAYASDGQRRGYPVTEEEWPSLPHGVYVVVVKSYDDETDIAGDAIEAFKIIKRRGQKAEKVSCSKVTRDKLSDEPLTIMSVLNNPPKPVEKTVIKQGKKTFEVDVYATMDDIRKARKCGLNGGVFVTAKDKMVDGRFEVFSVRMGEIGTIGLFEPIM